MIFPMRLFIYCFNFTVLPATLYLFIIILFGDTGLLFCCVFENMYICC